MAEKSGKIKSIAICAVAVLLVAAYGCDAFAFMDRQTGNPAEEVKKDTAVDTIKPEIGNITVICEYIGITEPSRQVSVYPKLAGEVLSVNFSVGDMVEAGDVLFTMNVTDILNNIKSLEAQLAIQDAAVNSAQTGVSLATGSAVQSQILSASGGVQQAEAAIRQAEQNAEQALLAIEQRELALQQAQMAYDAAVQNYDNALFVYELGEISKSSLEQAETACSNAEIAVNQAMSVLEQTKNSYETAVNGIAQAQQAYEQALEAQRIVSTQTPAENRRRAQDALDQAQAARDSLLVSIQTTSERLDDAVIRAPISGVIERRGIEPLNMASPQSPAFVISEKSSVTVSFRVPRSVVEHMEIGDSITLKDGDSDYAGTITEISPTANASGLFNIKARTAGAAANLPNGASVIVAATAQQAVNTPLVPLSAVHYENGVPFVFTAEDGFARKKQVEVGIFDTQNIQITAGVEMDSQIISTWSSRLSDGLEIVIVGESGAE